VITRHYRREGLRGAATATEAKEREVEEKVEESKTVQVHLLQVAADIESLKLDIEMQREWGGKLRALMAKQLDFNQQLDQAIYDAKATTKAKQVEKTEHIRHQKFVSPPFVPQGIDRHPKSTRSPGIDDVKPRLRCCC
jgi:hypothetical protein